MIIINGSGTIGGVDYTNKDTRTLSKFGNNIPRGTLKGLVIPEQWNNAGEVVAITIQTHREEVFYVAHSEISRELLALIHQEVEVSGKLTERLNGTMLLTVKKIRPINPTNVRTTVGAT